MNGVEPSVRERLLGTAGVIRACSTPVEVFILRDFLSESDCRHLIESIERSHSPSPLFTSHPDPEFRTSETSNLNRRDPVVQGVEDRIAALLGISPEKGERLQGQRYLQGQQFKPHHDYLRTDLPHWERQKRVGGQRSWTVMVYLNRPEAGGETFFPKAQLLIKPRPGSLVAWNNLDEDGKPNPATLHQGLPVTAGRKYIITKWFRERRYGPPVQERSQS